jgi:pimeloyl-ACP methyl ester carboxylesterase/class 3 adenylate cyclase
MLWSIPDDPRGALRWCLSKLRPLVDEPNRRRLSADRQWIALDVDGMAVDILALRDAGAQAAAMPVESLASVIEESHGGLLEGLDLPDQHEFQAWCIAEREEARALQGQLLRQLIARLGNSSPAALHHARALLQVDPLCAEAHLALFSTLWTSGRHHEAEAQWEASSRYLREQGIDTTLLDKARRRSKQAGSAADQPSVIPIIHPSGAPPTPPQATAEPVASASQRRLATVLFAYLRGFSGEAGEDIADAELTLSRLDEVAQRFDGVICEFDGRMLLSQSYGLIAIFGAPSAQEDHALRACLAASEVVKQLSECGLAETVRGIGIDSGDIIVRSRPLGESGIWEALGPAVERARQIADAAPTGGIAVGGSVWKQVQGFLQASPMNELVAGAKEEDCVFAITGVGRAYTRWQARAVRGLGRFQGRRAERLALERAMDEAGMGRGSIVGLIGEAGIGKSRLANELAERARRTGSWTVLETGVSPGETKAIFAPLRPILRGWLDANPGTPLADLPRRALEKLSAWGPDFPIYASALLSVLDVPVVDSAWGALGEPQRRQTAIDALVVLLVRASEDRAIMLIVEDLHWLDSGTEGFLDALAPILSSARLIVVTTSRPEYRAPWSDRGNYLQLRLAPLGDAETGDLLDDMLGTDESLTEVKRRLARDSGGNAFFLEESVQALIETRILAGASGAYRLIGAAQTLPLAPTVQGVLAARLDRLKPDHRVVIEAASIIGASFTLGVVQEMLGWPAERLRETLAELEAAEFLRLTRFAPEREYDFKHVLTQQVAYRSMLKATRARLHAAAGAAIEGAAGRCIGDFIETLAEHFEQGEIWGKAAEYHAKAAERAKSQYGYEVAVAHARRSIACAEAAGAGGSCIGAEVLLGDLCSLMGDIEAANRSYEAASLRTADRVQRHRIESRRHRPASIERQGGRIAYYEHGGGPETIVFIHPFVYGLVTFQPLVEELSPEFRIVTIDPRGTGASDPLPPHYGLNDHMLDVSAVLDAVGADGPLNAIGISRGAMLLIRLAALRPAVIKKMILVGCAMKQAIGLGVTPSCREGESLAQAERKCFEEALRRGDIRQAVTLFAPTIFSEPGTEELRRRFVEQCMKLPPETVLRFFSYDPDADVTELVDHLFLPTLLAHGRDDRDTPVSVAIALAERLRSARLYVFDGKGHLPMFTATAEFCDVVRHFIRPDDAERRPNRIPTRRSTM